LHGVSTGVFAAAVARAGFAEAFPVRAQDQPDPDFPTVRFPNPEEPGAMDLALAEAARIHADVVIANDPDGDRMAVAVPDPAAEHGWRTLRGDQVGVLLGSHLIQQTSAEPFVDRRLVATSIVSSTLLGKIAAGAGVAYVETLTGFKWVARSADDRPGYRFIFGYEEALGYAVNDVVRDKDGISAALSWLSLVSETKSAGREVLDLLDDLELRFGVHLTGQISRRLQSAAVAADVMARLRADPPSAIGDFEVTSIVDLAGGGALPPSDVLIIRLATTRVIVRPSGTEPKLKAYLEVVCEPTENLAAARVRAGARLATISSALGTLLSPRSAP
jgi:phosphomannomutase